MGDMAWNLIAIIKLSLSEVRDCSKTSVLFQIVCNLCESMREKVNTNNYQRKKFLKDTFSRQPIQPIPIHGGLRNQVGGM